MISSVSISRLRLYVFLITLIIQLYVGVGIVITCLKRLHDRIISLTGGLVYKNQFHHVTFIEVIVPIQESG